MNRKISRRDLLGGLLATSAALWLPRRGGATAGAARTLAFEHTHTGERLDVTYFDAGAYVPDALGSVNHFLRDHRTGAVHSIEPSLLDLLHELQRTTQSRAPVQVVSGYRSPQTNEWLRQQGHRVGRKSLHMQGKAVDIRLADVTTSGLREAALALRLGGVGYYPESDFLHVDVGRVRFW